MSVDEREGISVQIETFHLHKLQIWQQQASHEGRICVVGAVILDHQGRAFVQKRSLTRRLFPGCWDIVGGHIEPGETLFDGLCREVAEETGWQVKRVLSLLGQYDWTVGQQARREFDLLVEVDGDLSCPRLEWSKQSEFRWLRLDEVEVLKERRAPEDQLIYSVVKKALLLASMQK